MYKLGCLPDPEDLRDLPMSLVLPPIRLPKRLDYTLRMTPMRDQGNEGTCVAFASAVGVKEYQDSAEYKKRIELSPRFLYCLCKKNDDIPEVEGTYPRVAMKMLVKYGVCPESFWPYFPFQTDKPKKNAAKYAKKFHIKVYARLKGIMEMRRSLLINGPFLAGVKVYKAWFSKKAAKTGLMPMPQGSEDPVGGHAICIAGYDDTRKLFKFKNSWSQAWADKGYGYLKYEYLEQYCTDAWSATDLIENPKALVKRIEQIIKRFA